MAIPIQPPAISMCLQVKPLDEVYFNSFGVVISNPQPNLTPSKSLQTLPAKAVQANQGSALKYLDVTQMLDLYSVAPSKVASKAVMNMFVCAPRTLVPGESGIEGKFRVEILERHPFTTQTFIPLGLSASEQEQARYLVIVAPSLPPSPADESLPVPIALSNVDQLPGRGLPDLSKVQAFIATGAQAVTYGAGTWHAPMVAIGRKPIDFVVVQFANGIGIEDCQEVVWSQEFRRIEVAVPMVNQDTQAKYSKL